MRNRLVSHRLQVFSLICAVSVSASAGSAAPTRIEDGQSGVTLYFGTASDPVVAAAADALSDKALVGRSKTEDVEALKAFLATRSAPQWIENGALSSKAAAMIAEIRKADDWGLEAAEFDLPDLAAGASPPELATAEAKIWLAALKYARQARGGRIEPLSISNIWDMTPEIRDPATILSALAANAAPDTFLTSLHPKHPGFQKLRQALIEARGPQVEEPIDEALKIKIPKGKSLKPGQDDEAITLLRKRLKVEALSPSDETLYDARLVQAVKAFQDEKGIEANGILNSRTRKALNDEGEPKKADPKSAVDRIIANMERWRWLPEDLGQFFVMNNIPEYTGRVMKGDETLWEEKIIIGQPSWPTPILTSSMERIIFRPHWGVPDGIKTKELLPRLKRASGGGGFFDQLFGGGSSGGARVLAAYGLKPSYNGRPVDANSIDWNSVDIRRFDFVQPPGEKNPLGDVKFRFPNRHDVYMHDTTQRSLFGKSYRALSHGCIRAQNPRGLAEVLLGEDQGWDSGRVKGAFNAGGEVELEKPIPVYLTYFTARVDATGKLRTYSDIYGNDRRLLSALAGRPVRYTPPGDTDDGDGPIAEAGDTDEYVPAAESVSTRKKSVNKKSASNAQPSRRTTRDIQSDLIPGLIAN